METRILKYFLTVAKMQNITRAAQELHITQPTLSRQLKQLEDELGTQLLIRGKREITLTAEGKMLEHRAQDILTLINQTTNEIQSFNHHELSGTINLGYVESNVSFFVDDLIAEFQTKYPLVKFQTYSAIGDDIKDKIDTGILDLGFVITPIETAKYNYFSLPIYERYGVFVNQKHPLAHQPTITADDLEDYPIIYPWRNILQNELSAVVGLDLQKLNIKITANLSPNSLPLVHQHDYCMLGIDSISSFNPYNDIVFVPFENYLQTSHRLIWRKNHHYSELIMTFIEFVKHHVSRETQN